MNKTSSLKAVVFFLIFSAVGGLFIYNVNEALAAENFAIYPTTNYFTQIELDTRDGRLWQVHTGIKEEDLIIKYSINSIPLTAMPEPGRFMLSPTGNNYNFVLLDTVDGRTWQIQWSFDEKKRGIIQEIK